MISLNIDPITGEKYFEPNYNMIKPNYLEFVKISYFILIVKYFIN